MTSTTAWTLTGDHPPGLPHPRRDDDVGPMVAVLRSGRSIRVAGRVRHVRTPPESWRPVLTMCEVAAMSAHRTATPYRWTDADGTRPAPAVSRGADQGVLRARPHLRRPSSAPGPRPQPGPPVPAGAAPARARQPRPADHHRAPTPHHPRLARGRFLTLPRHGLRGWDPPSSPQRGHRSEISAPAGEASWARQPTTSGQTRKSG